MAGLAFCYLLQWMEGKGVVKLRVKWIGMNSFQGSEGGWSVQRSEEGNTVKAGIQCMVPSSTPPLPLEGRGALTHNTHNLTLQMDWKAALLGKDDICPSISKARYGWVNRWVQRQHIALRMGMARLYNEMGNGWAEGPWLSALGVKSRG